MTKENPPGPAGIPFRILIRRISLLLLFILFLKAASDTVVFAASEDTSAADVPADSEGSSDADVLAASENASSAAVLAASEGTSDAEVSAASEAASAASASSEDEKWGPGHIVSCPENRCSCLLLQTIRMGDLNGFDQEDALSRRIYSALCPHLCSLSEEDFDHFCREFNEEKETIQSLCYEALSDALLAYILTENSQNEPLDAAWHVLHLFLDPSCEQNGEEQLSEIRSQLTEETIQLLADNTGTSTDYIRWLTEEPEKAETAET